MNPLDGALPGATVSILPTGALAPAMREEIVALCTRAFGRDFGNLFDFVTDSMHVLARRDEVLIGHACWAPRCLQPEGCAALRTGYVDAVATDPTHQRRGIGSSVIRHLTDAANSFPLLGLSSTHAAGFYERLGWERWRGPTAIRTPEGLMPTPDETVLIRRTATTPPLDTTKLLVAEARGGQPW